MEKNINGVNKVKDQGMDKQSDRAQQLAAMNAFIEAYGIRNISLWARTAGVPQSTVQNFLKGLSSELQYSTLRRLARAQNVTVSQMMGESPLTEPGGMVRLVALSPGPDGWGAEAEIAGGTPRPRGLEDTKVFGVLVGRGASMEAAGLFPGNVCLLDPAAAAETGDAVYVARTDGQAILRVFGGFRSGAVLLRGWWGPRGEPADREYDIELAAAAVTSVFPVMYVRRK